MTFSKWMWSIISLCFILLLALAYVFSSCVIPYFFQPTQTSALSSTADADHNPVLVAQQLTVPWELVFLPDGDQLVTERSGLVKRLGKKPHSFSVPNVQQTGEGGLLGMVLDPEFATNRFVYVYLTTQKNQRIINEIRRYRYLDHGEFIEEQLILGNIPGSRFHNGGRLAFGPDGYLYATTGDAQSRTLSQDKQSLAGKILRLKKNGQPAPDNPFGTAIYSYGHRNPQGLAWDEQGQLWASEHGENSKDEINLIKPGGNYGWPIIAGQEKKSGMVSPFLTSGSKETWAPSGMVFIQGRLFFAGLRGQALFSVPIHAHQNTVEPITAHYRGQYGRIRNVVLGPDGYVYFMTSNRDGRGWPKHTDDRLLKIRVEELLKNK